MILVYIVFFLSKKILKFIENSGVEILHIHDIQIAKAAIKAANESGIVYNIDLHENRPEIMKFYKHVNSFFGKLFISPKKMENSRREFCQKSKQNNSSD